MNRGGTVKDDDIHVGDIVRVRQWDDMENEYYNVANDILGGDIIIEQKITCFSTQMKKYCGGIFTVAEIYKSSRDRVGYKFFDNENTGINRWFICAEMLEPFEEDIELEVADDNDIELLLLT